MNHSGYIPEKLEQRNTAKTKENAIHRHRHIKSHFGKYDSNYTIQEGELIYIRCIKINKGEFPAESYNELTEFYKGLNKADKTKIVFMNKT